MKNSLFYSCIRSFSVTLFTMVGIAVGMIPIIIIISLVGVDKELDIKCHFSPTVVPNANNQRKILPKTAPVILKLNIQGLIGTEHFNMHTVATQLVESRESVLKNNRVKALFLVINTPGGTVVDSDGIYRAIKQYKETYKVPVFAYIDGICASGGMYIAASADRVYASETSLIGSVGVLSPSFFNVSKLIEKIGIDALTLFAGKGKDDMNPLRPWRPGEEESYKAIVNSFYDLFVDIIATNRPNVDKARLIEEYGAHVFPAKEALNIGFIDGIETVHGELLTQLAKQASIDDTYQVIEMESTDWISSLFKSENALLKGTLKHQIEWNKELPQRMTNQFLYLWQPSS